MYILSDNEIYCTYLQKLFDYLDLPNHMYQGSLTVEKRDDNEYYVEFRDVSFKYPVEKRKNSLLPVLSTKTHRSSSSTNLPLRSIQFQSMRFIASLMKSPEPKPLFTSATVLHHAASATKLLYFMKVKSFKSELTKNSLLTAQENTASCGTHRRNIIQRKTTKMPLALTFYCQRKRHYFYD